MQRRPLERERATVILECEFRRPMFDDDYLERLRSRDEETAKHFDRYFRSLLRHRVWGKFTREREEELVDSAMAAAWENILNGEPRNSTRLTAYVTGICMNLAKLSLRPNLNNLRKYTDEVRIRDGKLSAEEILLERELSQDVRKVLTKLGRRDRGVLVDIFYHEKNRDEVCEKYRITREVLRLIVFRARQRFHSTWRIERQ